MKNSGGQDLVFAVAGILWGTVTVFRGWHQWREQPQGREAIYSNGRLMMAGAALALGCMAYVVCSLIRI